MAKYSREKVIEQFKSVHGDTYDYSLVEYLGDTTKVKIVCKKHGVFEQWVQGHKKGSGCRQCAITSLKPRYTTKQVIEQFKKKHGDKFDYSKVNYTHALNKVKIICQIHGEFEQLVQAHRRGQGCAQCMYDEKRHSSEHIIEKFKEIHKNTYDYSMVIYSNIDTHVEIICEEHGVFNQTPYHHLQGSGCPKCVGKYRTQKELIRQFKEVHKDKYDYSLVRFIYVLEKVEIICKEHGVFKQTPQAHISGKGCIKCAGVERFTTQEVVKQFREVHGEKYNYSQVIYKNGKSKIRIICPVHGVFLQEAFSHKSGSGCPFCAGNYNLETTEVIGQFKKLHGERYNYSKVDYKGAFKEVVIVCKDHGDFKQTPKSHKRGSGCPECAITIDHTKESYVNFCNFYANGLSYLYLIKCINKEESFYKVGISYYGANQRFNSKGKMPYKFEILNEIQGQVEVIWDLEKQIHKLLKKHKHKPQQLFHGSTECFAEVPEKVRNLIKKIEKSDQLMLIT
ncbi:GIY-YIG nuclease family protein [Acinetobacter junii]|uniref:GIY-YIG nuclease family protein n=1 Tax=Acinetobacter junii TaxID=40215 RepID=UPI0032144C62